MPDKSPENIAAVQYFWVFALAMLGGTVSYLKKLKNGKKWKVTDLLIEVITAAFAGVITFYLCMWVGIADIGAAALVGVSGHFSSRAITLFGKILDKVLGKIGE